MPGDVQSGTALPCRADAATARHAPRPDGRLGAAPKATRLGRAAGGRDCAPSTRGPRARRGCTRACRARRAAGRGCPQCRRVVEADPAGPAHERRDHRSRRVRRGCAGARERAARGRQG